MSRARALPKSDPGWKDKAILLNKIDIAWYRGLPPPTTDKGRQLADELVHAGLARLGEYVEPGTATEDGVVHSPRYFLTRRGARVARSGAVKALALAVNKR